MPTSLEVAYAIQTCNGEHTYLCKGIQGGISDRIPVDDSCTRYSIGFVNYIDVPEANHDTQCAREGRRRLLGRESAQQ